MSNQTSVDAQSCILPHMERTWIGFEAAQSALGVSRRRVYQLAATGEITRWYNAATGKLGFAREEIDAFATRERPEPVGRLLPRDDSGRFVSATS